MRARVLLATAALALIAAAAGPAPASSAGAAVTVGSKAFPESWVLAEAPAQGVRPQGR
jgi:glycine betaine/choline ABC-type transport system substrate-binding protein